MGMTETMATTTTMTMPQAAVLVLRLQQWRSASNKNKKKFDLGALKEIVARAHGRVPPLAGFDSTSLGEESSAGYFSETIRLHLRYYGAEDEEEMANKVGAFDNEHLFYHCLARALPRECRDKYLCLCYHSTPRSILMSDLGPSHEVVDQEEGMDFDLAAAAMVAAA